MPLSRRWRSSQKRCDGVGRNVTEDRAIGRWVDAMPSHCKRIRIGSCRILGLATTTPRHPMPTTTPPPPDLQHLAADLDMALPSEPLDWGRVRSRFLLSMLGRLDNEHAVAVARLHQRRLDGDEPTEQEWSAARSAAYSAAEPAVEPAARSAAWSAADSAAWSAAGPGAISAAWLAAWAAERAQQRLDLLAAIREEAAAPAAAHHTTTNDQ